MSQRRGGTARGSWRKGTRRRTILFQTEHPKLAQKWAIQWIWRSLCLPHYYYYFFKCMRFVIFTYLFIYFWLCWVFVSVQGLSLVVASGGHSSSQCAGLPLSRPLLLQSTGSRCAGSVVVAHGPRRSTACGTLPDQGSNSCPLHWQADSQPLRHQGSPPHYF